MEKPSSTLNRVTIPAIAAAAVALIAMCQCLILAARFRVLEPVFGGVDRMYRAHKYLGS